MALAVTSGQASVGFAGAKKIQPSILSISFVYKSYEGMIDCNERMRYCSGAVACDLVLVF